MMIESEQDRREDARRKREDEAKYWRNSAALWLAFAVEAEREGRLDKVVELLDRAVCSEQVAISYERPLYR